MLGNGAYAQKVAVPEPFLVPVPDEVSDDQAAGLLLQGMTAHLLLHDIAHVREGETVVVEAAGGGTGSLAVQLAKRAGAKVIALASSEEKREARRAARRRRDRRLPGRRPERRRSSRPTAARRSTSSCT